MIDEIQSSPLIGHRAWRIALLWETDNVKGTELNWKPLGPRLVSGVVDFVWFGPWLKSKCPPEVNEAKAQAKYRSKIVKSRRGARHSYNPKLGLHFGKEPVVRYGPIKGTCELYGTVIEQEYGWRAESALITSLKIEWNWEGYRIVNYPHGLPIKRFGMYYRTTPCEVSPRNIELLREHLESTYRCDVEIL